MIFKCKNCGGNVIYEPDKQTMYCPYCESADSEEVKEQEQSVISCGNCGGELGLEQYTSASKCPYCDNYIIFEERISGKFRPHAILPFKYGKQKTKKLLRDKFASCVFAPADFLSDAKLNMMEGRYVPFWMYDFDFRCSFEGEGHRIRIWRSGNKEYTETSVYRIHREMDVNFDRIPVDASLSMNDETMDLMEPYDYKGLEEFQEKYMSGFYAEQYNEDEVVSEPRALHKAQEDADRLLMNAIGGYTGVQTRHKQVQGNRAKSEFSLLPVWMYKYKYKEKEYIFHINGQTGKIVGKIPVAAKRVVGYGCTVFGGVFYIMIMLRLILMML